MDDCNRKSQCMEINWIVFHSTLKCYMFAHSKHISRIIINRLEHEKYLAHHFAHCHEQCLRKFKSLQTILHCMHLRMTINWHVFVCKSFYFAKTKIFADCSDQCLRKFKSLQTIFHCMHLRMTINWHMFVCAKVQFCIS
jgi:hypothetical protein